jgi:RNA polymerase sigma-70 factor (ECF subfamily)
VDLYQPLIFGWLIRQGVRPQEAEDLTQDVLAKLVKQLGRFEHSGRPGAFRSWLRVITVNRARELARAGRVRPAAVGGDNSLAWIEQLEDPTGALSRLWDEEHDQHVLRWLLALMEAEFTPVQVQAFRRLTFEGASAREMAAERGITVAAVYGAKARVVKRLRQEAEGLID